MNKHSKYTENTRFDWIFSNSVEGPDSCFDRDVLGDEKLAVLPTKGSLVPGWLLVIPKIRALSLALLEQAERQYVLDTAISLHDEIQGFSEKIFMFEHGPTVNNSATGCGVDQAHLHVVPLGFDLIDVTLTVDRGLDWIEVNKNDPWSDIVEGHDYYLMLDSERAFIAYPKLRCSQYFRRIIAENLGQSEQWDYKLYPHKINALRTIERIGRARRFKKAA